MKKFEIRLAGTGGQGVILASVILAEAAGVYEGWYAVQTQSYGPEARGGASRADVIISDQPILYPKCRKLDLLVGLSQQAIDKYLPDLKIRGLAVIDEFYVRECPHPQTLCLPLSRTAREKLGRELFTNILTLGAIAKITGLVSLESLKKAVASRVPKQFLDLNTRALEAGWELGAGVAIAEFKEAGFNKSF
ncbi:MAG: 2-oxoacid:acceptor oxidoreductase family protein [candidate division WOR-3 bacterium]